MPDHPNAAIIRHLYESDDSGPWDIVTDDVIWHVIGLIEETARRGDETITFRTAEIYHMRDGKITERWVFSDDTEAIKRFFA